MVQKNGVKTETPPAELAEVIDLEEVTPTKATPEPASDAQEVEDSLTALKTLLGTVEKLQKVRQEVGDIKSLLIRMLDGEVMSGEDLEQLKAGVGGLFRLVRAYSDHQTALVNAQSARTLLDQVLKLSSTNSPAR
jgi:Fic family protein